MLPHLIVAGLVCRTVAHRPSEEKQEVIAVHNSWFEALPGRSFAISSNPASPASALEISRVPHTAQNRDSGKAKTSRAAEAKNPTGTVENRSSTNTPASQGPAGLENSGEADTESDKGGDHEDGEEDNEINGLGLNGQYLDLNPQEEMIGRVVAFVLIGFTVFVTMVMYMLNFPDPQIQSYGNKVVSTAMSICCAVLVDKLCFVLIKPTLLHPLEHAIGWESGSAPIVWFECCASFILFVTFYALISVVAYKNRDNPDSLYAAKSFFGHITAFAGIHTFGKNEKYICSKCTTQDSGAACYLWYSVVTLLIMFVMTYFGQWIRTKLDPSLMGNNDEPGTVAATTHQDGAVAGQAASAQQSYVQMLHQPDVGGPGVVHDATGHEHLWEHRAHEGEFDARAIVVSFLIRQLAIFSCTGRIPSTKGDLGAHGSTEWAYLGAWIIAAAIMLAVVSWIKESNHWEGGEGDISENMHHSQMLVAMAFGWIVLTASHWIMQELNHHPAGWNSMTAFAVSPITFLVIILVDKLCEFHVIGKRTEIIFLNCAGFVLGFSWEVAFASSIETSIRQVHLPLFLEFGLCVALILFILPAWRMYLVPKAALPVPPRPEAEPHKTGGTQPSSYPIPATSTPAFMPQTQAPGYPVGTMTSGYSASMMGAQPTTMYTMGGQAPPTMYMGGPQTFVGAPQSGPQSSGYNVGAPHQ